MVNLEARIRRKFADHHIGNTSNEYKIIYLYPGKGLITVAARFTGPNDLMDRLKHGWGCKTFTTLCSLRAQYPSTECTAAVLVARENNIMFIIIMIVVIMFHIINTVYNALWKYNTYLYGIRGDPFNVTRTHWVRKLFYVFKNCSFTSFKFVSK